MSHKKRKTGYIDRAQVLHESVKLPNILRDAKAYKYDASKSTTYVSRFTHVVSVQGEPLVLDALVMENGICVLVCKEPYHDVVSISYAPSLSTSAISGRFKKGAINLQAGAKIITVAYGNQPPVTFTTPVGGKLLELNDNLISNQKLLGKEYYNSGYIAVVYPSTEIPRLDGAANWEALTAVVKHNQAVKNVCFEFAKKGSCAHGNKCRFKHITNESYTQRLLATPTATPPQQTRIETGDLRGEAPDVI